MYHFVISTTLDKRTNSNSIIYPYYIVKYYFVCRYSIDICDYVSSCTIELNILFFHKILISVHHEIPISAHRTKLVTTHDCSDVKVKVVFAANTI